MLCSKNFAKGFTCINFTKFYNSIWLLYSYFTDEKQRLRNVYYFISQSEYKYLIWPLSISPDWVPTLFLSLLDIWSPWSVPLMPGSFSFLAGLVLPPTLIPPLHPLMSPPNATYSRKPFWYYIKHSPGNLQFHLQHLWRVILFISVGSLSISPATLRCQDPLTSVSHPTVRIMHSLITHHFQLFNHPYIQFPSAHF